MDDAGAWTHPAPGPLGPGHFGSDPFGPAPPGSELQVGALPSLPLPGDVIEHDPFGARRPAGALRKRIASVVAGIVALIAKFGAVLKGLLIAATHVKLLTTGLTALASIAAYSILFGWEFAVGLVALLFVHEMGHVIQLRREGIRASAPFFIPFLGAMIAAKSLGENALAEARVGLAGPILGSIGAAAVGIAGVLLEPSHAGNLLLGLAYFGLFLNLFNLIPVVPFDGGRAMAAVAPQMWFVGIGGLVLIGLLLQSVFAFVFVLLALREMPVRWRQLRSRTLVTAAYYRVPRRARVTIGLLYVGLIVALAAGMYSSAHLLAHYSATNINSF
ncbi:MAG: site-2 protease family protein [Acidobacteriota bacterium]|nr:site-2 protease family protein [Acidobacteriota bacterium]